MTFKQQIELYLKDLPSKWKDQLVNILCEIRDEKIQPDCNAVQDCETVTSLSDFSLSGSEVSITYIDEHEVQVTRTFDMSDVINNSLEGLDSSCLATPLVWDTLTFVEKVQLLIDRYCDCCSTTTTTTL